MASLNLERIILDVLHWNPFLNLPHNYEDYTPVDTYGHYAKPRVEKRIGVDGKPIFLNDFFDSQWWNLQPWWKNNKKNKDIFPLTTSTSLESANIQDESQKAAQRAQLAEATPAAPAAPAAEQNKYLSILELQQEVERLQQEVERLKQEVIRLTAENDEFRDFIFKW